MIKENVNLSDFTTFKVGGKALYFSQAKTLEDLREALVFSKDNNLPFLVLGEGSNVLIPDEGFWGVVVKIEIGGIEFNQKKDGRVEFVVGAGENWDRFVETTVREGLYGVENLSGIPGTVGASPVQNIGAYGVEVKDTLSYVDALDTRSLKNKRLSVSDCKFGYRDSIFKKDEGRFFVITRVAFVLEKDGHPKIDYSDIKNYIEKNNIKDLDPSSIRDIVLSIRRGKFPDLGRVGTAGSFFKNPIIGNEKLRSLKERYPNMPSYKVNSDSVKVPLAWILDNVCNLKGFRDGSIGLYENQPLVLVNYGSGTAAEIKKFSNKISREVFEKTGIKISQEVTLIEEN